MIVRIWTTGIAPGRLDDLIAFCNERLKPFFDSHDGCLGCVFAHDGETWQTITFWRDQAAVDGVKDSTVYRGLLGELLASGILAGEQGVHKLTAVGGGLSGPLPI
jgi:hypothetical protein